MQKLQPYWYTPTYQPDDGVTVEFELRPLDQGSLYTVQASVMANGVPDWKGVRTAFENGVVGWKNITVAGRPVEFSRGGAAQVLRDTGSGRWMLWLGSIAGELLRNGLLSEDEKKT